MKQRRVQRDIVNLLGLNVSTTILIVLIVAIIAFHLGSKFNSNKKSIKTESDSANTFVPSQSIDKLITNEEFTDKKQQSKTCLNSNKTEDIESKVLERKTNKSNVAPPSQKLPTQNLETKTSLKAHTDPEYYSTTALGKILGIIARPFLFEELTRLGYIARDTRYYLTEDGISAGGMYRTGEKNESWPVWPISIGEKLKPIKLKLLNQRQFKLYHMTHIENLSGILRDGLLSHNAAKNIVDISNKDVNARRSKKDTVHNQSLHDYVPMYFNPRNAMLYQKQSELGENLVVLEINKSVCLKNKTIFTDKNAATDQCNFLYCLSQFEAIDWNKIYSKDWIESGVTFVDLKQAMMAECLVNSHVPSEFITKIHICGNHLEAPLNNALKMHPHISVKRRSSIFFSMRG